MSTAEVRPKPEEHLVDSQNYHMRLQRPEKQQKMLSYLVLAVLCGLLVGICVFCRLTATVNNTSEVMAPAHKNSETSNKICPKTEMKPAAPLVETSNKICPKTEMKPAAPLVETPNMIFPKTEMKPAAQLIASQHPQGKDGRSIKDNEPLLWTQEGDGFLQEMDYKNGYLTVKQEGTYFLYSNIAVHESQCAMVKHTVKRLSKRYSNAGKSTELMQSVRYRCPKPSQTDKQDLSDMAKSYLGGAFFLFANDSIYVTLNVKMKPGNTENFFGAFML